MSDATHDAFVFHADRPIAGSTEDRLGTELLAKRLAETLESQIAQDGLVVGIEGPWGSGKTSLLKSVLNRLAPPTPPKTTQKPKILGKGRPATILFQPWLVGTRERLLRALFAEIAGTIEYTYNAGLGYDQEIARKAKRLAKNLRRYARLVTPFASIVSLFSAKVGIPPEVAKAVGEATTALAKKRIPALSKVKDVISAELRQLDRKIVVAIDDLDRLEPGEIVEMLRLVRAVGDLPNVIYVIAYDRKVVADAVHTELKVDGEAFLGKMVQVALRVPKPEDFDLREWLREEISSLVSLKRPDFSSNEEAVGRFIYLVTSEGDRRLHTPRDVIRCINAFKLYWPPVADAVDPGDMIWLIMIGVGNPALFDWIAEYLVVVNQRDLGATVNSYEEENLKDRLAKILIAEGWPIEHSFQLLHYMFPAFNRDSKHTNDTEFSIFGTVAPTLAGEYESAKRLYHPRFTRFYFAFAPARGSISLTDEGNFYSSLHDQDRARQYLMRFANIPRPQGGYLADQLVDGIRNKAATMPLDTLVSVCGIFCDVMDEVVAGKPVGEWGRHWIWEDAKITLRQCLQRLSAADAEAYARKWFSEGSALSWLCISARDDIFARRKSPEDETSKSIPDSAFNDVRDSLVGRLRASPEGLARKPRLLSLLWFWKDAGDEAGARKWASQTSQSDEGLVILLEGLRSWKSTNGVVDYPIQRDGIEPFLDYEHARSRVEAIASSGGELAPRARDLIKAFVSGDDDRWACESPA